MTDTNLNFSNLNPYKITDLKAIVSSSAKSKVEYNYIVTYKEKYLFSDMAPQGAFWKYFTNLPHDLSLSFPSLQPFSVFGRFRSFMQRQNH